MWYIKSNRGQTMKHKISMFDYLFENYGISRRWLSKKLGFTGPGFQYAEERGFSDDEFRILEGAIHEKALEYEQKAKELKKLKLPDSYKRRKEAA